MICQNITLKDQNASRFSLNLHSNTHHDISKKSHTISSLQDCATSDDTSVLSRDTMLESGLDNSISTAKQPETNSLDLHWKTIETYYVARLDSLHKEIETASQQNAKLSLAREELVQEVLKLHQKSMELGCKNEDLARQIAERENHISAFMYNPPQQQQQQQQPHAFGSVVGVTLVDKPYSPPTPPLPPTNNSSSLIVDINSDLSTPATNQQSSTSDQLLSPSDEKSTVKKEPGIFRQLSLRLSTRKRRQQQQQQQEDTQQGPALQISDPITTNTAIPAVSSSEPLLHPAVVISSSTSDNKYNLRQPADSNYKRKKNLVFGNDLIQQAKSENSVIPNVVLQCIREVESRGLSVEGIYRKSGTFGLVKDLQDAFDENKNPKLSKYQDINVITSLLKIYFRDLPVPLIPNDFILPPTLNDQERLNKTYTLLHSMPKEAYCTIKLLVQHLKRVHQNHTKNRMPSKNLAVVFGPTLMRFTIGNEEQQMRDMINTIEYIISQSHTLFADYS